MARLRSPSIFFWWAKQSIEQNSEKKPLTHSDFQVSQSLWSGGTQNSQFTFKKKAQKFFPMPWLQFLVELLRGNQPKVSQSLLINQSHNPPPPSPVGSLPQDLSRPMVRVHKLFLFLGRNLAYAVNAPEKFQRDKKNRNQFWSLELQENMY